MSIDRTVQLKVPEGATNNDFYWIAIGDSNAPGGYTNVIVWRMLPGEVVTKWRWYFDYRAALYKVQNPRKYVEIRLGFETLEAIDPIAHEKLLLSRKITSCKAKITEWTRKLADAKVIMAKRSPMFPIENEPGYINAVNKLEAKKSELARKQQKYAELDNQR